MDTQSANNIEREGLKHLEHIEAELSEIKDRTANPRRSFIMGILQGAGVVIGSLVALVLIGWLLYIFGFLTGLGGIAAYLQNVLNQYRGR